MQLIAENLKGYWSVPSHKCFKLTAAVWRKVDFFITLRSNLRRVMRGEPLLSPVPSSPINFRNHCGQKLFLIFEEIKARKVSYLNWHILNFANV